MNSSNATNISGLLNVGQNETKPVTDELQIWVTYSVISVYCIVYIVGILGNASILVAIYRFREFHRETYYFIASTSTADILVSLLLPLHFRPLVTNTWTYGQVVCKIQAYAVYVLMYPSAFSILFTALCRYVQVVHSSRLHIFRKRAFFWSILSFTWLIGLVVVIPSFADTTMEIRYFESHRACIMDPTKHSLLHEIGTYTLEIPCMILVLYFYIHIYAKYWCSRMTVRVTPGASLTTSTNTRSESQSLPVSRNPNIQGSKELSQKVERKLTRSTLLICVSFFGCWAIPGFLSYVPELKRHAVAFNVISSLIPRTCPLFDVMISYTLNQSLRKATNMLYTPLCFWKQQNSMVQLIL